MQRCNERLYKVQVSHRRHIILLLFFYNSGLVEIESNTVRDESKFGASIVSETNTRTRFQYTRI